MNYDGVVYIEGQPGAVAFAYVGGEETVQILEKLRGVASKQVHSKPCDFCI